MLTVSVIVVSCAVEDYLERCLDSLTRQSGDFALEVLVIDNTSTGSLESRLKARYPEATVYKNKNDKFYCQALNEGIGRASGEFVLCLNDDAILGEFFIREALGGFKAGEKVGMVSGKVLRSDGRTIDSAGLFLTPWRTARERGYGCQDKGQYQHPGYIFGVTGAIAFYRRQMLEEIREKDCYFDERFNIFYEDLDVSWRAERLGWKGYYLPQAIAYHLRGGTVRQGRGKNKPYARRYLSDERHADLVKNRYLAIIKNESLFGFLIHAPFILGYDCIAWGYIILRRPQVAIKILSALARRFKQIKLRSS